MATAPAFASAINNGSQLLGANETNLQVPGQTSTVLTAGASGTKIEEIMIEATATSLVASTAAGLVYLFLYDGSTYHLFDTIAVYAITASGTAAPFRVTKQYQNLVMKTGWSLRASQNGNASIIKISAFGGDL